jgi:DNA-binding HxlR family transcriptional regulator
MDQAEVDKYLVKVPSVIVNAVAPLGDKKCWALYIALLDNDEGLRFNQLKEFFKAESPEISRSLKSLANAGLITKRARCLTDVGNNEVSYYVPTVLGKSLIKSLYKGLLPAKPIGIGQATNSGTAGYSEIKGSNTRVEIGVGDRIDSSTGYSRGASRRYDPITCQPRGDVSYGSS